MDIFTYRTSLQLRLFSNNLKAPYPWAGFYIVATTMLSTRQFRSKFNEFSSHDSLTCLTTITSYSDEAFTCTSQKLSRSTEQESQALKLWSTEKNYDSGISMKIHEKKLLITFPILMVWAFCCFSRPGV